MEQELSWALRFLDSTVGRTLLICLFFALVILFLRFLYGPRGIFRDPRWDEMNREAEEQARLESDAESLRASILAEKELFLRYVDMFYQGLASDSNIRLKAEHSLHVLRNAIYIADNEAAFAGPEGSEARRLLLHAALYHDVGRFSQYLAYGTFQDAISADHGRMGAKLLRSREDPGGTPLFLKNLTRQERARVCALVSLHNRMEIPPRLKPELLVPLLALRDADKLDIYRVMQDHLTPGKTPDPVVALGTREIPGVYNPEVMRRVVNREAAPLRDMKSCNDFRLVLCGWVNDLHFAASRELLNKSGYLENIMAALPDSAPFAAVKQNTRAALSARGAKHV